MTSDAEQLFSFMQEMGIARYDTKLPDYAEPLLPVVKKTKPKNAPHLYLLHAEGARAYAKKQYFDTMEQQVQRGKLYLAQPSPRKRKARRLVVKRIGANRYFFLAPFQWPSPLRRLFS